MITFKSKASEPHTLFSRSDTPTFLLITTQTSRLHRDMLAYLRILLHLGPFNTNPANRPQHRVHLRLCNPNLPISHHSRSKLHPLTLRILRIILIEIVDIAIHLPDPLHLVHDSLRRNFLVLGMFRLDATLGHSFLYPPRSVPEVLCLADNAVRRWY